MKDFKDKVVTITEHVTAIGSPFTKAFAVKKAGIVFVERREHRLERAEDRPTCLRIRARRQSCEVAGRSQADPSGLVQQDGTDAFADGTPRRDILIKYSTRPRGRSCETQSEEKFHGG